MSGGRSGGARPRAQDLRNGDFFSLMRRVEAENRELPRLGEARRPKDEPIRLAQEAALDFATSSVSRIEQSPSGRPRVFVRFLGMFGPQGPLPIHLTEFARERERSHGDPTFARFVDLFHHRLLLMFYRAWRQAQPAASFDHPQRDRFAAYVDSLFGHGVPDAAERDAEIADARRFFSGRLAPASRPPEGLAAIVADDFGVPARVAAYRPRWIDLPRCEHGCLGATGPAARLGIGAVLGARVRDIQHQADLVVGPLDLDTYRGFLPGGRWLPRLRLWALEYAHEFINLHLVPELRADQVPRAQLGRQGRLGLDTWLGARQSVQAASDLSLPISATPAAGTPASSTS